MARLCRERGWLDTLEYVDKDFSATNGKRRPAYQQMLTDIRAGEIDRIGVWDLDRLYRQPRELEDLIDLADEKGLLLATVTGDADLATDNGRLYARIKGAVGKSEVDRKSARQRAAARQRAESGKTWLAHRAFGYTMPNPDGTGMKIIESEAALLRDAYAAVLAGRSLLGITKEWTANGVLTTRGNPWAGVVLRKVLINPRNAALRAYKGEIIADAGWPAIVDVDTFEAARAVLDNPARICKPRNGYGRQRLLSGLARCGKEGCGAAMSSSVNRKKKPIYVCRACKGVVRSIPEVDAWVIGHVADRLSRDDAAELTINRKRADLPDLRAAEDELLKRRKALQPMLSNPKIPTAMVEEAFAEIDEKLAAITVKMTEGNDSHVLRDFVPTGAAERDEFFALPFAERRAVQQSKFDALTLDRRRAVIDRLMTITIHPGQPATGGFRDDLVVVKPKA